jgi:hypothetical protein
MNMLNLYASDVFSGEPADGISGKMKHASPSLWGKTSGGGKDKTGEDAFALEDRSFSLNSLVAYSMNSKKRDQKNSGKRS